MFRGCIRTGASWGQCNFPSFFFQLALKKSVWCHNSSCCDDFKSRLYGFCEIMWQICKPIDASHYIMHSMGMSSTFQQQQREHKSLLIRLSFEIDSIITSRQYHSIEICSSPRKKNESLRINMGMYLSVAFMRQSEKVKDQMSCCKKYNFKRIYARLLWECKA